MYETKNQSCIFARRRFSVLSPPPTRISDEGANPIWSINKIFQMIVIRESLLSSGCMKQKTSRAFSHDVGFRSCRLPPPGSATQELILKLFQIEVFQIDIESQLLLSISRKGISDEGANP